MEKDVRVRHAKPFEERRKPAVECAAGRRRGGDDAVLNGEGIDHRARVGRLDVGSDEHERLAPPGAQVV